MSALKDFLVSSGGFILTRDRGESAKGFDAEFSRRRRSCRGARWSMMATALQEILQQKLTCRQRVDQVHYLWRRLDGNVPLLSPAGRPRGVYRSSKNFLPDLAAEQFPAEALAAFIYQQSGIRITKGPPLAPSQVGARHRTFAPRRAGAKISQRPHGRYRGGGQLRLRNIATKSSDLRKSTIPSRSKYDPAHFVPL